MPPIIDRKTCTFCKNCVEICPLDVLKSDDEKKEIIVKYPDECWHCRACVLDCPTKSIKLRYPLSHFLLHMEIKGDADK